MAQRPPDRAFGIRPQAGQGTQQRGLAATRRALDQQRLAGTQVKLQVGDKGMPVRAQHLQACNLQGLCLVLGGDTWQGACLRVGIEEAGKTVKGRPVLGERIIRFAEERQ